MYMHAGSTASDEEGLRHSEILLKQQSLRTVAHSLSPQRVAAVLEGSLRGMVEEGTVWRLPLGAEIIVWRTRHAFCSAEGLCIQKVRSHSKLPCGDTTVVPFHAISKVRACMHDTFPDPSK